LTQIGAGLAASIIFAFIYTILANREHSELIRTEIAEQLSSHLNATLQQVAQLSELFLPTSSYPATKEFDLRFNEDLTNDLCTSSFYFFRGTSAKYIPARLKKCNHRLEVAQAILLNPADDATLEARAADRRRRPEYEGMTLSDIKVIMKREILFALVALFDCRDVCDIEIGFSTTTSPVRIEIFDNAIYTSLYRSAESQRNTHPETVRFNRDSQNYQIFREELRRQLQLTSPHKRFTIHDTDDDLREFISPLHFGEVGTAELNEQRELYQRFIGPFTQSLAKVGCTQ
jgi:hypothetical protein